MRRSLRCIAAVITCGVLGSAVACSSTSEEQPASRPGQQLPVIVTNFYPVQWLATELVGDTAEVISLTPEGTEPHDLALDAEAQKALGRADVVLYLGADFQPDVARAVGELDPSTTSVDLLTAPGVELITAGDIGKETLTDNRDPHIWLSPVQMQAMAEGASNAIGDAVPQLAGQVDAALPVLQRNLSNLDDQYRRGLTSCASQVLLTSHAAFGYLADEYGLEQVPIAGLSPEDEPDPQTLQSIADVATQRDVDTVFFEDALPSDLARTVADEIGAEISLLSALEFDPRGSIGPDEDYVTVMAGNLDRIEEGLGCQAS